MRGKLSTIIVLSLTLGSYLNVGIGMDMSAWSVESAEKACHACCPVPEGAQDSGEPESRQSCCVLAPGILAHTAVLPAPNVTGSLAAEVRVSFAVPSESARFMQPRAPPRSARRLRSPRSPRAPPTA